MANVKTALKKKLAAVIATMARTMRDEHGTAQNVKRLCRETRGL